MINNYLEFKAKHRMHNFAVLDGLIEMMERCGVDQETISLAIQLMVDDRCKYELGGSRMNLFSNNLFGNRCVGNFFNYLCGIEDKLGPDGMKEFLTATIYNISNNMDAYDQMDRSKPTNFMNLFLRELVIAFPEDVKLINSGTSMKDLGPNTNSGNIEAVIGGVCLGHIHFDEGKTNVNNIQFTDFRTLPGLEKRGLGSYIFGEFCRQVVAEKPGYTVTACNVANGRDGEKTYSNWGAYPTNNYMLDGYDFYYDEKPLTQEELDAWGDKPKLYYFTHETIQHLAEKESPQYGHDSETDEME